MFNNRKLLVATKHHKEKVIAPLFEKKLGVRCFTSDEFDTDTLGTFSGEVSRKDDALTTLRKKCILAMEKNHCDLVIASEGSFGVHPSVFFASADDELIMLKDAKNDLEIVAREISLDTNFNASVITNESDLLAFAQRVQFPSHALILKPAENNFSKIVKGINDSENLKKYVNEFINEFGMAYVETDMRAQFNPTRMKVIEKAAQKLLQNVQSTCPNCKSPGFAITKAIPGLPCSWCKKPTDSTLSYLYTCNKCEFTKEALFPHQKNTEDPTYCHLCNP
ncbi:hypothetical protein HKT18_06565 [Flavobacterium sp. IMCC34852]|uniref:DUF6671 domain-containing protein n=1 Tax=Flavobacterium rivulicola TaxID=2732161 RepID=A0A7Y3R8J6_9FLAO|nr:DUF6671 family protein [Flavobacterium sp. IMCC34852]NNT71874.1 hypothetical protein [Flavobacterium sp. IMCC34852]